MAENNIEKTVSGSILQSQHFIVKFVAGFQKGLVSNLVQYDTDWMDVMTIILEILELFPTSVNKIEKVLDAALDDWLRFSSAADNIKTSVKIDEEVHFLPPPGSKKSLKLSFSDMMKTEVLFHIEKKSSMKTLKALGAAAMVENLKLKKDIAKLGIPVTLLPDLFEAFENDFSVKYYNNCHSQREEQSSNRSQHCTFAKQSIKNYSQKHQKTKKNIRKKKFNTKACSGCGKSFHRISSHKCRKI